MMAALVFVVDAALRALVVAAVTGALLMLIPRARATLRLRAWTVVLYGVLALPVLGLVLPAWQWPVSPPALLAAWTPASQNSIDALSAGTTAGAAVSLSQAPASVSVPVIVATAYVAGVLWFICQAGLGWRAVRRLRARARPVLDPVVLGQLERQSRAARLATPPLLTESARLFAPITVSVRRPMIVLPDDWRTWPAEQVDAVLAHEISHVARRDALTQRLTLFYRAVFWFSPLSWWLHRELASLAELASDESALDAGIEPLTYADALLACFVRAHERPRRASWHLAMARVDDTDAACRLERILSWKGGPTMTRSKLLVTGVAVLVMPLTALASSVRFAPGNLPTIVAPVLDVAGVAPQPIPAADIVVPAPVTRPVTTPVPPVAEVAQTPAPQTPAEPQKPEEDDFLKGSYEMDTPGLIKPEVVRMETPRYTPDAMRQKLQGSVVVDLIVATDGRVSKARVKVSLDKTTGLDEAALDAARKSVFTPGMLKGEAVPVHAIVTLHFRLH
jgi:TonB family protein